VGGQSIVTEEWPSRCPECDAALVIGSLFSVLTEWPEFLARYGIRNVAMEAVGSG
jgi:hypothetical protein